MEKFFLPVILDNGDILIYGITNGRKNLDEIIKAEEIITFRHVDEEFVFNVNTRKWYHREDGRKPSHKRELKQKMHKTRLSDAFNNWRVKSSIL